MAEETTDNKYYWYPEDPEEVDVEDLFGLIRSMSGKDRASLVMMLRSIGVRCSDPDDVGPTLRKYIHSQKEIDQMQSGEE